MDLSAIPLLDHHCHALRRPQEKLDGIAFRRHFSESTDAAMDAHLPHGLFYSRGLRDLATLIGCEPTEAGVVAARDRPSAEQYAGRLFEAANITTLLVDTGLRRAQCYSLDEHRAFLPCKVSEILRLETLVEQWIVRTDSFGDLEECYRADLKDARARGIVAFKSIAAYRGGLQVAPVGRDEAAAVYPMLRARARRDGQVRLSERALLEYMLRIGLEEAAAQGLPVQFHVGFGDDDADLRSANPLHLRPLLRDESLRGVSFVLLHNYPYVREAGYLASIYGHVYVDLSLTIPFAAHGGDSAIAEALELAPVSKLLLATDASAIAELFYLGALYVRENLATALDRLQGAGWLTREQAEETAWKLLYGNAAALYGVD